MKTRLFERATATSVSRRTLLQASAGVLGSTKEGKEVFYWIEKAFLRDSLSAVLAYLDEEA